MSERPHILLISQPEIADGIGGAITIFINFANMLEREGYHVKALYDSDKSGRPKNLSQTIVLTNLRTLSTKHNFSTALNHYLEANRPDIIVFFFPILYAKANLDAKFDDIPRILMIHSRPDIYFSSKKKSLQNLKTLYKNTTTQVLLPSFISMLPEYIKKSAVVAIANPVYPSIHKADLKIEKKKLIYLSRIDKWKGQKFLIQSFKKIASKYPDWQLDIYGSSTPKEYINILKELIKKEKLEHQVFLKGVSLEPLKTYLDYDFCVFPSYFEGFGLGLSDALSLGLPAIGLKGCTGVNELIIDGYNGFLTDEDENLFAQAMETLITNRTLRLKMGKNAIDSIVPYNADLINKQWLELIANILNKHPVKSSQNVPQTYEPFSIEKIKSMKNYTFRQKLKIWFKKHKR